MKLADVKEITNLEYPRVSSRWTSAWSDGNPPLHIIDRQGKHPGNGRMISITRCNRTLMFECSGSTVDLVKDDQGLPLAKLCSRCGSLSLFETVMAAWEAEQKRQAHLRELRFREQQIGFMWNDVGREIEKMVMEELEFLAQVNGVKLQLTPAQLLTLMTEQRSKL